MKPFTIEAIQTHITEHPLKPERIIVASHGRHDRSRFLTVAVRGTNGLSGFGEAATTPRWSGETADTARAIIEDVFRPPLTGRTFAHPSQALDVMDSLAWANSFARGALDCALWDLFAREQGASVLDLIADRRRLDWLPTRASVGAYPPEQTVKIARAFYESGVGTLKFKIGSPAVDDAERLRAVRAELGAAVTFTVDANCAYATSDEAVRAIEKLLKFDLAVVEQPSGRDRLDLLADVRKRVDVPVLADESVWTMGDLEEALALDAFDIVSLYPGKNGGFTRCLEMAKKAQAAGKMCVIGSNLETDLGQAAMATLASGLSAFPGSLAQDLPGALYYERPSVKQPLRFENGCVHVPEGPGFGVEPAL